MGGGEEESDYVVAVGVIRGELLLEDGVERDVRGASERAKGADEAK